MTQTNHLLTLNNGIQMPALGLGVYQSSPKDTIHAVTGAIESGYRMIDTASAYGNEKEVGQGILNSGIKRSDVFITTKLWISEYSYERALKAFDTSLRKLGMEYVDLYLLHWPMPTEFERTVSAYKAAEKLLSDGRARAIGVCNHSPKDMVNLLSRTSIVPAVNQVELHPYFIQKELRDSDKSRGIITQSWSPIGGVNVYAAKNSKVAKNLLEDPVIISMATKYSKTPAQIVLRWHLDHGLSAIPKSVRTERIRENIDIFDFKLTTSEKASIDGLETGERGGPDPRNVDTKLFGFTVENDMDKIK